MSALDPNRFRVVESAECNRITRENVDALLDARSIEIAMSNGNWWIIRRNGQTKRWKRDATRICIPFKMGLYGYGTITERDFIH